MEESVAQVDVKADVSARTNWLDIAMWIIVASAILANIVLSRYFNVAPFLFVLITPFVLVHGTRRYGVKSMAIFYIVSIVISNIYENLSIVYGFPFGFYHYTAGGKIFHVPALIGPAYAAIGYISWQTANILLGFADERLDMLGTRLFLPLMAGSVMAMFDLVTDPIASTVNGNWIWHDGGGFYGVPLSNFLGWWLVTWSFFQVFAFWLAGQSRPEPRPASFWAPAVLLYGNLGFTALSYYLRTSASQVPLIARNGLVWRPVDLGEGVATVLMFTILPICLLALNRLFERKQRARGAA